MASGCNDSTVARSRTSVRRTGWSGTCRRSCRCSTSTAALLSNGIPRRSSSGPRMSLPDLRTGRPRNARNCPGRTVRSGSSGATAHQESSRRAATYLDEELMLAGAELTWQAGPPHGHEKGPGICHGTAGNGYAFLKAFDAHRRRALARPGAPLRRARTRAGAPAPLRARPRPLLALDGRPRGRPLRSRVPRRR